MKKKTTNSWQVMVKITSSYINFQKKNKKTNINKFHNIRRKNIINLKLTANTLNTKEKHFCEN